MWRLEKCIVYSCTCKNIVGKPSDLYLIVNFFFFSYWVMIILFAVFIEYIDSPYAFYYQVSIYKWPLVHNI